MELSGACSSYVYSFITVKMGLTTLPLEVKQKKKCFVPRCISAATLIQEIFLTKGTGMVLWFPGIFTAYLVFWVFVFNYHCNKKKTFMHEGCVPYRTMHPDAECLRQKKNKKTRTVMEIKFSLKVKQ